MGWKNLVFGKPIHDWSSDFADSIRYMAVTHSNIIRASTRPISKQRPVAVDPVLYNMPRKNIGGGASYNLHNNHQTYGTQGRV